MGSRQPQSTAAAQYASSDPGFEALPLAAILAGHETLLGRIKLAFGSDRATFERELMPLVRGYARFVHLLPATADNYFHTPGGLLQLGLETAFFSLQGTDAHIVSGRATISERRDLEPRWRVATFIGGLCCELHRVLSHLIVASADGEEWPACLGGLADWLEQRRAERYYVRWRPIARESRGLGLFALPHVVPGEVLQSLGQGNAIVVPQLMASIAGVPQYRDHNVLDELVRRSLALVIDRNLLANADRYGTPQYGSHLERYLVDALRRLAAGHSAWTPNREKSRVWLGPEGLFLVWPGAADDVLSLLESDQLAGIPKSPHTLLELLLDAGVLVAPGSDRQTWPIQPPGLKGPFDAVKLATPSIVLAGLDPLPPALTASLLAVPGSASKPSSELASETTPMREPVPSTGIEAIPSAHGPAVATEPSGTSARTPQPGKAASGGDTPSAQLSLLGPPDDAMTSPVEPSDPPMPPKAPPRPIIGLKAPMRLHPAVRDALADAVSQLNESARGADVCTTAEGIFVPLVEFERRGVQPAIAMRALQEARMLRHLALNAPPTTTREIRGTTAVGVIVAPEHVEGLDLSAFTPSGTEQASQRTPDATTRRGE